MALLAAIDIKLLFTHAELEAMHKKRLDDGLSAVFRLLDDTRFTTIDTADNLFIDSVCHVESIGILNAERKARVLLGLRPL